MSSIHDRLRAAEAEVAELRRQLAEVTAERSQQTDGGLSDDAMADEIIRRGLLSPEQVAQWLHRTRRDTPPGSST